MQRAAEGADDRFQEVEFFEFELITADAMMTDSCLVVLIMTYNHDHLNIRWRREMGDSQKIEKQVPEIVQVFGGLPLETQLAALPRCHRSSRRQPVHHVFRGWTAALLSMSVKVEAAALGGMTPRQQLRLWVP